MKFWFSSTPEIDAEITANFLGDHEAYMRGDYSGWMYDRDGALAAVILLDQWSRNMFRKQARAFASDAKALELCMHILGNQNMYNSYTIHEMAWLLLPLEHCEDKTTNCRMITEIEKLDAKIKAEKPELYEASAKDHLAILMKFAVSHNETIM